MERLQKYMAHAGIASRRKSEELIQDGKVKVNGQVIRELGVKIDPLKDKIEVEGKQLKPEKNVYILLHKPVGYVTTLDDPQGRPIVTDLIKGVKERIYPVGRLDLDTSGLLILTNDGEMTNRLMHPKHEIVKTYVALVKGKPTKVSLQAFASGLELEDGMTAPATVGILGNKGKNTTLKIQIHEGRNRQVRRMCQTLGHPVVKLKRVSLGFLSLDGLTVGKWRFLRRDEIKQLKTY